MLILSWNVAGLTSTLHRINSDYGSVAETKSGADGSSSEVSSSRPSRPLRRNRSAPRSQFLADFIEKHSASIFCVQEAKIPFSQLSSRSEPLGCSSPPGYESFWSCCVDASKRGYNGVATFARTGLVRSADAAPLGERDLDEQGRCVMTDHGDFVLFNVYVPAGGGQPLSFKMRFLAALRRAMRRQREDRGKKVVLVGDLNIAHRREDVHWKYRVVFVDRILAEIEERRMAGKGMEGLPQWKRDLEEHWGMVQSALETKEALPTQTKNVTTGATFDKFRVRVRVSDSRYVLLGKAEITEDEALSCFEFRERTYVDEQSGQEVVARESNGVFVDVLSELMSKIPQVEWDNETQKLIASTCAGVCHYSPTVKWLDAIIEEDGMIDTFRHFYPKAEGRFTCWNQYTNKRYENEGCRIDYCLVDESLLKFAEKGNVPALRCCNFDTSSGDALCEEAALHAATASGTFRGAGFDGNGIAAASQQALDTQFGPPHTGIVYTPPSYSDHVATSLLLCDAIKSCELNLDEKDPATKKSQPHKSQQSIASFFGKNGSSSRLKSAASRKEVAEESKSSSEKMTLQNFFQSASRNSDSHQKGTVKRKVKEPSSSSFKRSKSAGSGSSRQVVKSTKNGMGSILNHFTKR